MERLEQAAIGTDHERVDARDKVTGRARYAAEHPVEGVLHGAIVGASIPAGRVLTVDVPAALHDPDVVGVVWHANAARLQPVDDGELLVLQRADIAYHGQPVALVVATSFEAAQSAARRLRVEVEAHAHHSELSADDPGLFTPEQLNAGFPAESDVGDVDAAMASAIHLVDEVYTTPYLHNMPMEPHAALARWDDEASLTMWDTTQNPTEVAATLGALFDLDEGKVVVHSEHVGGGFGSKGTTRPHAVLAALAAKAWDRPVKVVVTRAQMFDLVGYRTPTIQRVRLGADAEGRLLAIDHDVVEQTSLVHEFAEQTGESTRHMYAAPNRRVTHRLARLNVPTPRWLRAPGEAPGMYAVESAIDELAAACGIDPVELRIRNEPDVDPSSGQPFSSRHVVECLREGARRFGWADPITPPCRTVEDRPRRGLFAVPRLPPAEQRTDRRDRRRRVHGGDRRRRHRHRRPHGPAPDRRRCPGRRRRPCPRPRRRQRPARASGAGGSSGTASWGFAVTKAAGALRERLRHLDGIPAAGCEGTADTTEDVERRSEVARFGFGAQFVGVRVHAESGEVRVDRAVGVFAVGTIVNPRLARSQLIGGMTMGLSMGLLEEGIVDLAFGDTVNGNLADYHIAVHADVPAIEASWLDEHDDELNPMGSKGIGEIGIVGTAAAVTNAVFDATGVRVRACPCASKIS